MDFLIKIGVQGTEVRFTQFNDVLEHIKTYMAQWNNFSPQMRFEVFVRKVPSEAETIKVHSGEVVQIKDVFGQR